MEDTTASQVTLRNTMRRPLTFRVAGKTVRLSPGAEMKVPAAWLGSAELQHMCGSGLVSAEKPRAQAQPAGGEAPPTADQRRTEDEGESDAGSATSAERRSGAKSKKKDQPES